MSMSFHDFQFQTLPFFLSTYSIRASTRLYIKFLMYGSYEYAQSDATNKKMHKGNDVDPMYICIEYNEYERVHASLWSIVWFDLLNWVLSETQNMTWQNTINNYDYIHWTWTQNREIVTGDRWVEVKSFFKRQKLSKTSIRNYDSDF